MKNIIIGRKDELEVLQALLTTRKAEFLAIFGRRRVGKTFLICNFFAETNCIFFKVTGIRKGKLQEQLTEFIKQIGDVFYGGATLEKPRKWLAAFDILTKAITKISKNKKVVLFFDEFPWMVTKRSRLLQALEYYWNQYWTHDSRLKLVICGSSSSWIIKNIVHNTGGLYNRITRNIELRPFSLAETKLFLSANGIKLDNNHITAIYMVTGGIPHYLAHLKKGLSSYQCIDMLCFQKNGLLVNEFNKLFVSLFDEAELYTRLIRVIANHRYGIGQPALIKAAKMPEGGRTVKRLKELEEAGFIISFIPYGHQERGVYYKVIDEYCLFYLFWIEPKMSSINKMDRTKGYWLAKTKTPQYKSWAGYAFEAICYKHLSNIRLALNIEPGATIGTWRYIPREKSDGQGAQIDLLFDRDDNVITVCEIKYTDKPFKIDKSYADNLLNKVAVYKKHTGTTKQIFIALISANGVKNNYYVEDICSGLVTLADLFKE